MAVDVRVSCCISLCIEGVYRHMLIGLACLLFIIQVSVIADAGGDILDAQRTDEREVSSTASPAGLHLQADDEASTCVASEERIDKVGLE